MDAKTALLIQAAADREWTHFDDGFSAILLDGRRHSWILISSPLGGGTYIWFDSSYAPQVDDMWTELERGVR